MTSFVAWLPRNLSRRDVTAVGITCEILPGFPLDFSTITGMESLDKRHPPPRLVSCTLAKMPQGNGTAKCTSNPVG